MIRHTTTAALLALFSLGTAQAQQADVTLAKAASADPVDAGAEVTYTLTVGNAGPDPAVAVTVVDPLPEGSTFVAASPECVYDPIWHRVDCALPLLPPAASVDLTVVVEAAVPPTGTTQGVYLSGETSTGMSPALFALETFQADRRTVSAGGTLVTPRGVAALPDGTMVVADKGYPSAYDDFGAPLRDGALVRVERVSGAQTALSAGGLMVNPSGVVVGPDGMLYVADPDSEAWEERGRVLRVDPTTGAQTVAAELGLLLRPTALAVEPAGTLLVADATGRLVRVAPDSGAQALVSEGGDLYGAEGVAVEAGGTAVVTVPEVGIVRVDLATGSQSLLVAANGFEVVAPIEIEVAANGDLYAADPYSFGTGAILHFDPVSGTLLTGFLADPSIGYSHPRGLELVDMVVNHADVTTETSDPDPDNNRAWVGVEVTEGDPPTIVEIVVDETLSTTDAVSLQPIVVITVDDGVMMVDEVSVAPVVMVVVDETIAVGDTVSAGPLAPVVITVNESVTVSDLPGVLPAVVVAVSENVTVTDQVLASPAVIVAVAENVSVSDAVSAGPLQPVVINVNEQVNVSDLPGVLPAVVVAVSENVTVTDQVLASPAVIVAVTENVAVSDAVAAGPLPPVVITVNEQVTVSDLPGVLPAVVVTVTENVTVTDQVVVRPAVIIAVSESVTVADDVQVTVLDNGPPTVLWVHTVADTGDGQLAAGETTATAITQLLVVFSEAVADPAGDTEPDDVTNPANYLLLADGGDGVFDTVSCADGWSPNDVPVAVGPVSFLADLGTAAVRISGGPLPAAKYRLHVCGSTSITDLGGEPLDGNGDGEGGDDHLLPFVVSADQLLANPNLDDDLAGWTPTDPAGVQVEHNDADADGAPTSGSVRVANLGAAVVAGVSQCVAVDGGSWHRVGTELGLFFDSLTLPAPRLAVGWFLDEACEGPQVGQWSALPDPEGLAAWRDLSFLVQPPDGSSSARLQLMVEADVAEDYVAYWDDVTFFADPAVIFYDGFESGGLDGWAP